MSDDIRRQSDTLEDNNTLNATDRGVNDIRAQSDTLKSADATANTNTASTTVDNSSRSSGDSGSFVDNIRNTINSSISNVDSSDTVPMTGLDDTANDKVLDASDIGGRQTLTEAAGGSGKEAAFGVLDALSGRGANVQSGVPLDQQQNNQ